MAGRLPRSSPNARSHVRPRPPSSGRPAPERTVPRRRVRAASIGAGVQRPGLPLPARLVLGAAVVALVGFVLITASGGLARLVADFGARVGDAIGGVASTSAASGSPGAPPDAPILSPVARTYTNVPTVEIAGDLPQAAIGQTGARVRLFVTTKDLSTATVAEIPAGATSRFAFAAVELSVGQNDFTAAVVSADGVEGSRSASVRVVYDASPPPIRLASVTDGSKVSAVSVSIAGKTQARSTVVVQNATSGATASGTADASGVFSVAIALQPGPNELTITATDLAGNSRSITITVTRGAGALKVDLQASAYRFKKASLPAEIKLTARVTDATGKLVGDATVTFSISIPGVPVVTGDVKTNAAGNAVFKATIPAGATVGTGPATAFVKTANGSASGSAVITIIK